MQQDYLTNQQGHLVPKDKVKPEHQLEDDIVLKLLRNAEELRANMASFKHLVFGEIDAFIALLEEEYQVVKGGKKGNVTLQSYDGNSKVVVSVGEFIAFGPELTVAKSLIDDCIRSWSQGTNDNIRQLIEHAFRTDENNQVSAKDILGLRRLAITDDTWKRAMDTINEAVRVNSTKRYVRFYRRPDMNSDFVPVPLDIAKL